MQTGPQFHVDRAPAQLERKGEAMPADTSHGDGMPRRKHSPLQSLLDTPALMLCLGCRPQDSSKLRIEKLRVFERETDASPPEKWIGFLMIVFR